MEGKEAPAQGADTYKVKEGEVKLNWVEVKPEAKEILDPEKAVIFLPAWNWEGTTPIITGIARKIANGFGQVVHTINGRADQINPDYLYTEAEAIAKYLSGRNLSEVTIVGHSYGAVAATDLAVVLERSYPQIRINGLVLMSPMGMGSRSILDLGKKFFTDIRTIAPEEHKKTGVPAPEGGEIQFLYGIWQDMKHFKLRWPGRALEELKAMAQPNPYLQQVKAPVIVFAGKRDFVSDYRKYIPQKDVEARAKPPLLDDQLREWVINSQKWEHLPEDEQRKFASKDEFLSHYMKAYRTQEEKIRLGRASKQILKENIMPQAENSGIIIAAKGSHHGGGMTDIRIKGVVSVASRIFKRGKESDQEANKTPA